jgi:cardiolipin synthase
MPTWLTENIYYKSSEYFQALLLEIRNAQKTIDLETYIFQDDNLGQQVIQELLIASNKGVAVRLIVDGFGSYFWISNLKTILKNSKIQLKVFRPFLFFQPSRWQWLRVDLILKAFSHANKRLHRKTCTIDGKILFAGSFNVTAEPNRDTGVRVTGLEIQNLQNSFKKIWANLWIISKIPITNRTSALRLNDSLKKRLLYNADLAEQIKKAKRRIWITNAYFVPPPFILKALNLASLKKLDIQLLLPARSDSKFMKFLTETYYSGLLQSGIRIFEFQNRFLHAKTLLIDEWAIVGTSNMNHRSLFHDYEIDVVLTLQTSLDSLSSQFEIDKLNSTEIKLHDLSQLKLFNRFAGWLMHLFRYWL